MNSVIAIVGPTAIGKTNLALHLSRKFGGEIVSADSRQVYRHMDIGTAKPTIEEQKQARHYLIDEVNPDEEFSLALYQNRARQAIEDIHKRNKQAFLVGGSGLYIWSLLEGWRIPEVPPDPDLRKKLEDRANKEGGEVLFQELAELDPVAAQNIDPRNVRRVIRALEVCNQGSTFSELQIKKPFFDYNVIGLTTERADLFNRIDLRVDWMIENGLLNEVEKLVAMGYGFDLPAMSGIGYKQMGTYLQGKIQLTKAVERTKFDTHRFARSQYSWFSLKDKRIRWFKKGEAVEKEASKYIQSVLVN